ncbi:MFS transporter [Bradyrhizobium elkanii]|uniref:MFS transporter n=1 Tax=Bradyrhizobium elkanii TaxID=29448 RepID=UPI0035148AE2
MRNAVMHAGYQRAKPFYGWYVVTAAFVVTLIGFGSAYTFSSFVESLQREFGASRGSVSLVFSFAGFLYFGLGMISGPLADRWGARRLAGLGMVLVGLGMVLAGQAQTILQVYAAYSIGIGAGVGCAYVPTLGAVQRWFVRRRGFASGLAVSGIGVGTLVMPPLATWLITSLGWRDAYVVLGVVAAVAGIGASLLIADDPRRYGTGPDGDPLETVSGAPLRQGVSIRAAVRTARFAGLYAACLISAFGVFVPFVHLVPFAVDHQVAPTLAVLLLGMIGVGSTAGRFFLGGIADRVGRDAFLVAMYLGMAVSLAIWAIAGTFWSLTVFALLFGPVLWRLGRDPARCRHRPFRRPQCRRHHRHPLHQRRCWHAAGPERRRLRLRHQPQLPHSGRDQCSRQPRRRPHRDSDDALGLADRLGCVAVTSDDGR